MKTFNEFITEAKSDFTIVHGWGDTFNIEKGKGRKAETVEAGLSYDDAVKAVKSLGGIVSKPSPTGYAVGGDIRIEVDPKDATQWIVTVDKGNKRVQSGRDYYDDYSAAKTAATSMMMLVKQKNPSNKNSAKVTRVKSGKLVDI